MTYEASAETFAPYIGKAISLGDGSTLTLVAVDRHKSPMPGGGFTLLLSGAPTPIVPEGMHRSLSRVARALTSTSFPSTRRLAIIRTIRSSSIDRGPVAAASIARRKDSLECDAIVQSKERHAVLVRLPAGRRKRPMAMVGAAEL